SETSFGALRPARPRRAGLECGGDVPAAKASETAQPPPGRAPRVARRAPLARSVDREGRGLPGTGSRQADARGSRRDTERPGPARAAGPALQHAFVGALAGSQSQAAAAHRGTREDATARPGLVASGQPGT